MTDSHQGKPLDTAVGADTAASYNLGGILLAIQTLQMNTNTRFDTLTSWINDLEKDIAEGSDSISNKNVPITSAGFTPTTSTSTFVGLFTGTKVGTVPSSYNTTQFAKRSLSQDDLDENNETPEPKNKKQKKNNNKKPVHSSEESDPSNDEGDQVDQEMDELMKEYEASKPKYLEDPTTSDIATPLAKLLETWFWTVYLKDKVKTELSKSQWPANADALIPPKINEAIFQSLNPAALTKDLPARLIQNAFMKASQLFAKVWSTLLKLENHF